MWIRRGLRFECQPDCGKCCTTVERDGSVFLEPMDIERLSRHLEVPPQDFVAQYASREGADIELGKRDDGQCVFLADGRCGVYEARPLQCRTYPFLPLDGYTPIESEISWRHEKTFCPGIGKGRLYKKAEIVAIMRDRADVGGFAV